MPKPLNTPSWVFEGGKPPRYKTPDGKKRNYLQPGHPRYVAPPHRKISRVSRRSPQIAEVVLDLHAQALSKDMGQRITKSQAQTDLNYRSKLFRSYLPEAKRIIKSRNNTTE